MLTALRHPACDDQSTYGGSVPEQRRLLGPGQPLTDSAFETVNSNVLGVVSMTSITSLIFMTSQLKAMAPGIRGWTDTCNAYATKA